MRCADRAPGRPSRPSRPSGPERRTQLPGSLALALALGLAGWGCGKRGGEQATPLERELAAQLTAQLGADTTVRCEAGPPRQCLASLAGSHVPLEVTDEAGQVRWSIKGLVISGTELERQVVAQLAALGIEPSMKPRCGPALQIMIGEDRVLCRLGELGVAWATVAPDGSYSLELALGEAAAARSQDLDEAQLDELSRALDREQGKSEAADADGVDDGDDNDDDEAGEGSGSSGARQPRGVAGVRKGAS